MAAIYRKYRPQVFGEVFGQEHVLETLMRALKLNRVAHAYLFAGSRGVGKTTVARLLAKAVNCTDEKNRPCGKCSNCKAIAENRFVDLIEIDAASNRGIDEIRELREKIQFTPSIGKKRVYIIDEVHMLTREAFNALLKTLEEPPEHTIFIFATTEAHKIPVTVLSRCQRFDFRLAGDDLVKDSIKKIVQKEKFKIDDKVIELIARVSGGSFRDAQSLLDQLSSHLLEKKLSYGEALEILNLSSMAEVEDFLALLMRRQSKKTIEYLDRLGKKGISYPDFLSQVIIELRRRLIEKIKRDEDARDESRTLVRLMQAEFEMKTAPIESLPIELAIYELCFEDYNDPGREIESTDRNNSSKLKAQNASLQAKTQNFNEIEVKTTDKLTNKSINQSIKNEKLKMENKSAQPIDEDIKHAVVSEVATKNKTLAALLSDLSWAGDSKNVKIFAQYTFHKNKITDKKNLSLLENSLEMVLQCKSRVDCEIKKDDDMAEELDNVFGEDDG